MSYTRLNPDYETITTISDFFTTNSEFTPSSGSCVRWGKVVQVLFNGSFTNAITVPASGNVGDFSIGTLEKGYRPVKDVSCVANGNGNAGLARLQIGSDGNILVTAFAKYTASYTIAAGASMKFSATFITP